MKSLKSRNVLAFASCLTVITVGQLTCSEQSQSARSFQPSVNRVTGYSSDLAEFEDIESFYKKVFGSSNEGYMRNWNDLQNYTSARVIEARVPYIDSWYPEKQGGTNVVREGESEGALTKYDRAFYGGTPSAAKWEAENNSRQTPDWYGHCNGTSVAGARFQNPQRSVYRPKGCLPGSSGCVELTPFDIRALLSEINMSAKAKFISGNRCRVKEEDLLLRPQIRPDPTRMDACDDVNPGSFHLGLVNFLGRQRQPIIFDAHRDEQVWNYPIFAYTSTSSSILQKSEAIDTYNCDTDRVENCEVDEKISEWIFNSRAVAWVYVETQISYRAARSDFQGAGTTPDPSRRTYRYLLELDADQNVLGGEWLGESRINHPDFLWMAFEPATPNGSASRSNPFVSNDEVIKIWAESVGFDPNNPFRDKPANPFDIRFFPENDLKWGHVDGYYQVVLDGRTNGAAFTDKPIHLRILAAEILYENTTVEIVVNGRVLGKQEIKDGFTDITFNSLTGINKLELRWQSQNVAAKELDWEFSYFGM